MLKTIIFFVFLAIFLFIGFPAKAHENSGGVTIHITKKGFEPSEINIDKGQKVIFENASKEDVWPASDIHPTHQIYPEFDFKGGLVPGASWEFTFQKAGEWTMHDHLHPSFIGKIIVKGEKTEAAEIFKKPNDLGYKIKVKFFRLLYKFFPGKLENALKNIKFNEIAKKDDTELIYWLDIIGAKKAMDELLADTGGGSIVDCHQEAHIIGRVSYEIYGAETFKNGNASCHSGFYHGAMESFLKEKGTADLAQNITNLCNTFSTHFANFECLHGVGHGVMALTNYDLPAALSECKKLSTSFEQSSCFGGTFMENIVAAEGLGARDSHETQWVSSDPHFPCNSIDQSQDVQYQCYLMQTSRMLDIFQYDFTKVADQCLQAPSNHQYTCFQSYGRDAAGQKLREPKQTLALCDSAPGQYYPACVQGALQVVIEFWGDKMADQPHKFCEAINKEETKQWCFEILGQNLVSIFGKNKEVVNNRCQSTGEYKQYCLKGAAAAGS